MIDLTPLEVRKKKGDFRRAMRGYEPQLVDDFLDVVADRLEQLVRENAMMHERAISIDAQISDYRERERALTEALVTAQEMREEMRRQIEREVELIRREAEADAEAVRTHAAQIREREEENIRRLRARQTQFVQSYRTFLERELAELAVMGETLEIVSSDSESDSAPAQPRKRSKRAGAAAAAPEPEDEPPPLKPHGDPLASELVAAPQMELEALPVADELPELELLEDTSRPAPEDEDDGGGWVSTLLEGKGD